MSGASSGSLVSGFMSPVVVVALGAVKVLIGSVSRVSEPLMSGIVGPVILGALAGQVVSGSACSAAR